MPRYDAYAPQSSSLSPQKGWMISALTGSLVVHAGLVLWFHFQQIENFFTHYKDLEPGKWAKISHVGGYEDARRVILDSIEMAKNAQ